MSKALSAATQFVDEAVLATWSSTTGKPFAPNLVVGFSDGAAESLMFCPAVKVAEQIRRALATIMRESMLLLSTLGVTLLLGITVFSCSCLTFATTTHHDSDHEMNVPRHRLV